MRKIAILFIIVISVITYSNAQYGTVNSFTKISQTQVDFPITLLDGAQFGQAVTCIGDLNNDGIQDLAIGSEDGTYDGKIYITFLDSNGTVNSMVEIKQGLYGLPDNQSGYYMQYFGISVDTIGDLNNDGVVDLIVGMPYISGGNSKGFVFILFMNSDGTVNSHKIIGENMSGFIENLTDTQFGYSVAGIGDLDQDGVYDIAVGGIYKDNGHGAIWILFLNSDGTIKNKTRIDKNAALISNYFNQAGSGSFWFGSSIAFLGDLDKDGVSDISVGSIQYHTNYGTGSTAILFLNSNGTIKDLKPIHPGIQNFGDTLNTIFTFGGSIANIGDVNGDNVIDLAITAPFQSESQCNLCGATWIVMLDSLGNIEDYQRISDSLGSFSGNLDPNDVFGGASSGIGDFNGDMIPDIVVTAKRDDDGGNNRGAVYILHLNGVPDSSLYIIDELEPAISIYPNPANDLIRIEIDQFSNKDTKWQLFDISGILHKQGIIQAKNKSINIRTSNLSNGIYIIRFRNQTQIFTKKIVISR